MFKSADNTGNVNAKQNSRKRVTFENITKRKEIMKGLFLGFLGGYELIVISLMLMMLIGIPVMIYKAGIKKGMKLKNDNQQKTK